jgi:hypothetical protein
VTASVSITGAEVESLVAERVRASRAPANACPSNERLARACAHGREPYPRKETRMTYQPADILRPSRRDDGTLVDQYDRDTDACTAGAAAARSQAESMREAARLIRHGIIVLGRLGGDRQVQRLGAAGELFERIVARDELFAHELEEAIPSR